MCTPKNKKKNKLIFVWTKHIKILLLLVKKYTITTDIITYYLLPKNTALKCCNKNMNKQLKSKYTTHVYLPIFSWLVGFYGISTFVGYLTPNVFLCK